MDVFTADVNPQIFVLAMLDGKVLTVIFVFLYLDVNVVIAPRTWSVIANLIGKELFATYVSTYIMNIQILKKFTLFDALIYNFSQKFIK
jgi:hypothetical protein